MQITGSRFFWAGLSLAAVMVVSGCGGGSAPGPAISVSVSPSGQAVDQSMSVTVQAAVTNDTSSKGVTWKLSGPGSLSGTSGPSVSYASPSTSITSAEQATVTATSVADPTKSASVQITVNPYPAMLIQSLSAGTVGVAYSQPIVLTGGTSPFQWSVFNGAIPSGWQVGGSVPSGLTLSSSAGTISGTPTAAGTWYFDATVTDADGVFLAIPMSLQINPAASSKGNAVPFLNQPLVPSAVAPGGTGVTLKVSGTGFVSGATVNFNGTALATTFVDGSHLSAAVPATDVVTAMTATITVVNPTPAGGASNAVYFQVGAPLATVKFANAANSPLQISEPFGLAVGDFNQDGKPDLAITGAVKVYSMLSKGDGTFTAAPGSPYSIPSPPFNDVATPYVGPMAVGDFNHSGHLGLAVGEFNNDAVVILEGNGDGSFASSVSSSFIDAKGAQTSALGAADFNDDGNLDLAIVNALNGISPVVLGYGDGAFNPGGQLVLQGSAAAVGDFNGDGKLDVASGLPVSLGNGDGTFRTGGTSPGSTPGFSAIVAGDFNGDGKLDLAGTDQAGNNVIVLLGNGDGTFQAPQTIPVGHGPDAIAVGDFNNDGKLDLAIANYGDGTVTLLLGNGDGTFTQASGSPFLVGKGPDAIVAADFNGDGKLDLAVANSTDNTVSILLQQ